MWLPWRYGLMIAAAGATTGTVMKHWPGGEAHGSRYRTGSAMLRETGVVMGLYSLWMYSSRLPHLGVGPALERGRWIVDLQNTLHIPSEKTLQSLVLPFPWLVRSMNVYYLVFHVPALVFTLFWIFISHREWYSRLRNSVALTTLFCLLVQLVPVAPPRMLTDLGYVDTALKYNQSVYGILGRGGLAGQVSAMPSVHVAWAVIVGYFGFMAKGRRFTRILAVFHAVTTFIVVAATANHYWMDGIVATAFLVLSLGIINVSNRAWKAVRPTRTEAPTT